MVFRSCELLMIEHEREKKSSGSEEKERKVQAVVTQKERKKRICQSTHDPYFRQSIPTKKNFRSSLSIFGCT